MLDKFIELCERTFQKEVLQGGTVLFRDNIIMSNNRHTSNFIANTTKDFALNGNKSLIDRNALIESIDLTISPPLIAFYASLSDKEILELEEYACNESLEYQRGTLTFPYSYKVFLKTMNGLSIMNGAMILKGVQKMNKIANIDLPYSPSALSNKLRSPSIPSHYIEIGSYMYNRSDIYMDSSSEEIFVYDGDYHDLELTWSKKDRKKYMEIQVPLLKKWDSLGSFLHDETQRLWHLFQNKRWTYSTMYSGTLPN